MKKSKILSLILFNFVFLGLVSKVNLNIENFLKHNNKNLTNIEEYEIQRSGTGVNSVTYEINYKEDDVWYWNQTKDDFVPPQWVKKTNDKYKYTSLPTFTISNPSEEIIEHPSFYGWTLITESPDQRTFVYEWSNEWQQTSLPSIESPWVLEDSSNFDTWELFEQATWGWNGSGYWKEPTRTETGTGNKSIWIDWEIKYDGNVEQSGKKDILNSDINIESSKPNNDNLVTIPEGDEHSNIAPTIVVPEPQDGTPQGVQSTTELFIDNLSQGWIYNFNAKLMYRDENNVEHQYSEFEDNFSLSKDTIPTMDISSYPDDGDNGLTFKVEVNDPKGTRNTPINWVLKDSGGTIIESGSNTSNLFSKTFSGLNDEEEYNFECSFGYSLSESDFSTPTIMTENLSKSPGDDYDEYVVTQLESWVTNIYSNEFILNLYIETENNEWDKNKNVGWTIQWFKKNSLDSGFLDIAIETSDLKIGQNSLKVEKGKNGIPDVNFDEYKIKVFPWVGGPDHTRILSNKIKSNDFYDLSTNIEPKYTIQINNADVTNNSSKVKYEVADDYNLIQEIQLKINDGNWVKVDSYDPTNVTQYLEFENLNINTTYKIQLKAIGVNDDFILSNDFRFKTDYNTNFNLECEPGKNSILVQPTIEKYEYLDEKYFKWNIKDLDENKYIKSGTNYINNNRNNDFTIDNLNSNTNYEIVTNIEVEGKVIAKKVRVKTLEEKDSLVENSFIVDGTTNNNFTEFNLEYIGSFKTIEYSYDGISWIEVEDFSINDSHIEFSLPSSNSDQSEIYFRVNHTNNSLYSFYKGIDNELVIPPDPIDWKPIILTLIISFIVLTMILSTAWGVYWIKRNRKPAEINIWGE